MKRCPECRRDYTDETLNFCLDDGTPLVNGPALSEPPAVAGGDLDEQEPATAVLHTTAPPSFEPGKFSHKANERKDNPSAVAVLPFANLSSSEDSEYFSDGLAEELLNVLSKINGLQVAARTSAFAFKGKQVSVEEIGRALHVSSVLEGSVRMAGERVRIAVQLVDAQNGYHLWSETYDRTMDDIFAIQDDIAHSVVGELRERLIGKGSDTNARKDVADEVAMAIKGRAADPEAQRLMLLGRYLLERSNEADVTRAVGYFRQALDIDPDYALCWAELGRAFFLASGFGWRSLDTDNEKAEEAIKKALELEPNLAEGHARLGMVRWKRDGDVRGAGQSIERALSLAPQNIDALIVASNLASDLGQLEKAIDYSRRVIAIDPLNSGGWAAAAIASFYAGDLGEAEAARRRSLEIAPQRTAAHAYLGLALLGQGRADEALAEALLEPENSPWRPWSLTIIHHAAGRSSESDAELAKFIEESGFLASFQIAEIHSMRGEVDEAFEWLDRAIDHRDPGRFVAKVSPLLKPLHDDPRWKPLLKKIGFPD